MPKGSSHVSHYTPTQRISLESQLKVLSLYEIIMTENCDILYTELSSLIHFLVLIIILLHRRNIIQTEGCFQLTIQF